MIKWTVRDACGGIEADRPALYRNWQQLWEQNNRRPIQKRDKNHDKNKNVNKGSCIGFSVGQTKFEYFLGQVNTVFECNYEVFELAKLARDVRQDNLEPGTSFQTSLTGKLGTANLEFIGKKTEKIWLVLLSSDEGELVDQLDDDWDQQESFIE